jgi:hypothetical protein
MRSPLSNAYFQGTYTRLMSYECEDCGASFDTLSRLRLHDCPSDQPADTTVSDEHGLSEGPPSEDSGLRRGNSNAIILRSLVTSRTSMMTLARVTYQRCTGQWRNTTGC